MRCAHAAAWLFPKTPGQHQLRRIHLRARAYASAGGDRPASLQVALDVAMQTCPLGPRCFQALGGTAVGRRWGDGDGNGSGDGNDEDYYSVAMGMLMAMAMAVAMGIVRW